MRRIKVDIVERLEIEAGNQRNGVFDIFHDEHGNRGSTRTKPDTDMAELLEDAIKRIRALEVEVERAHFRTSATQETCFRDGQKFEREKVIAYLVSPERGSDLAKFYAEEIRQKEHYV